MKNILNAVLLTTVAVSTSSLYAQTEKVAPAYGDNPNLLTVLAHKTGAAVQNTAEKIGAATERGISKVKPALGETWENTRDYSKEQADLALNNTRQGINTAVQKVNETKDQMTGTSAGRIPIIQGQLSQSSTSQPVVIPQNSSSSSMRSTAVTPSINTTTTDDLNPTINPNPTTQQNLAPVQAANNEMPNDTITVKSLAINPTSLNPNAETSAPVAPQSEPENTQKTAYQFDLNTELEKELSLP